MEEDLELSFWHVHFKLWLVAQLGTQSRKLYLRIYSSGQKPELDINLRVMSPRLCSQREWVQERKRMWSAGLAPGWCEDERNGGIILKRAKVTGVARAKGTNVSKQKLNIKIAKKYAEVKVNNKMDCDWQNLVWVDTGKEEKCLVHLFYWYNWPQNFLLKKLTIALKMKPRSCSVFPVKTIWLFWWG